MLTIASREQVIAELDAVPEEYLPLVLQVMRSLRESVVLKPARDSFRQGWYEARQEATNPIASLWDDLDAG